MHKKEGAESLDRQMWAIIEMLKHEKGYTDAELAAIAHTTVQTLSNDRKNPRSMKKDRWLRYLSIGLSQKEYIIAIEQALLEKKVRSL